MFWLSEIVTFVALVLVVIWLPGALVIKVLGGRGRTKPRFMRLD